MRSVFTCTVTLLFLMTTEAAVSKIDSHSNENCEEGKTFRGTIRIFHRMYFITQKGDNYNLRVKDRDFSMNIARETGKYRPDRPMVCLDAAFRGIETDASPDGINKTIEVYKGLELRKRDCA